MVLRGIKINDFVNKNRAALRAVLPVYEHLEIKAIFITDTTTWLNKKKCSRFLIN